MWFNVAYFVFSIGLCKAMYYETHFEQYMQLASTVQGIYRSSSVFIVNGGHYENMPETLLMAIMSKEFSRKYVLSQNINFTKLREEVEYYSGRSVQPLFVVLLKTYDDLHQFADTTKLYPMTLHTWLVIFMQSDDKDLNNYCHSPRENLFNLVISTKMLVKCFNDTVLKEWYSIDKNRTEIFDYGTWTFDVGFRKLGRGNFYDRRSNLKGILLKAASVKDSSAITGWNGTMDGFFGTVLKELAKNMNFRINFTTVEDYYGCFNETTNKWSGVIGRLVAREIDIGVGEFSMNRHRQGVIDYTIPLILSTSNMYIKRPNMSNVEWSSYIKAFHIDIWSTLMIVLILTPIFLAIMWKIVTGSDISLYNLVEKYLSIWGIYCQKPLPNFPAASSLRIAYISIFMSSWVLFAVYLAYLTSYLTIYSPSIPFNSYEGFVKDGTYKLIVFRQSSNHELFTTSNKPIFSNMRKLMKDSSELPTDIFTAIKQVCNENIVLFTNQLFIEKISRYSPCKLMSLTQGKIENIGFALTKHNPYTEILNYNIKRLASVGIINCLKRRYYRGFIYTELRYLPVSFWEILPIFGILCLGITTALQVLLCEYIVSKQSEVRNKKRLYSKKNF